MLTIRQCCRANNISCTTIRVSGVQICHK